MAMFHLLKIRTSIDIFKNEKCKVTFGLEYILQDNLSTLRAASCFVANSTETSFHAIRLVFSIHLVNKYIPVCKKNNILNRSKE